MAEIYYCPDCGAPLEECSSCAAVSYFCTKCNSLKSKKRILKHPPENTPSDKRENVDK